MRRWIKRTFIGLFGATVLFGSLAACSHQPYGGGRHSQMTEEDAAKFRTRMVDRVASKLELDATQKQRLTTLADTLREQRKTLMGGTNPRADVQALVAGDKFDRERAANLVNTKTELLRTQSPAVIAAAADFYDSLKPEQQAKVREFMQGRRHGWWGRG